MRRPIEIDHRFSATISRAPNPIQCKRGPTTKLPGMMEKYTTRSSTLEIHLLGHFLIFVSGHAVPEAAVKGRKARSLLKLIALDRRAQIVRDQAMDALWPDLDATAAASQLYKAIYHIRKAFDACSDSAGEWIEITDELVRLVPPGGVETDIQRFERTARSGLRDRSISHLQRATSIYAGDLLPMDYYAEWAAIPREHYRQLYLDVLIALAAQYEQRGELSEAAEMLRLALEKDPPLEAAHRGLMRIFAKRGQATRAFRQYDLCRDVLKRELDVEPASETAETLADVRERRLTVQHESFALQKMGPAPLAPIVSRRAECAEIERLLDRLEHGQGGTLVIRGGVGLGKTRLLEELALRARQRGLRVLAGGVSDDEGRIAYGTFVEIFETAIHERPELQEYLPVELGKLVPSYEGDGEPVPHADRLAAQGYLFAEVQRLFARLVDDGALVVILDDLHDADEGTQALFSYLRRHGAGLPILFAAAARGDGEASTFTIEETRRETLVEVLDLGPLTREEHEQLLEQHAPAGSVSPPAADRIYEISEGNPLFGLELQRYWPDDSDVDASSRHGAAGIEEVSGRVPPSLRRVVQQQLDGLSPSARHLLSIATVIGRTVSFDLISAVWSGADFVGEHAIFEPLEELTRARMLDERGLDYSFRHVLVREALYGAISEARRRALHALVARRLIELHADHEPVEQIAAHHMRAGEVRQGVHYLVRAGERAEAAYAHEDAIRRFREALSALDDLRDTAARRLRREVLERIGDVYRASGNLDKSYEAYQQAVAVAEELPLSGPDLVELHRKIALVAIFNTDIERSEHHLSLAFDLLGDDQRARARLLIIEALQLWHMNRLEEAADLAHEALDLAEKEEAATEASQACEILAMTYLPLGRWEEGLKYEMQRQVYGWSPEIVVATDAHLCLWEYHVGGEQPFRQARSFIKNVAKQASILGDLRCVAVCHYALGTMHLWRGESREAIDELDASLQLHASVGSPAGMAYALARKGVLYTMRGAADLGWEAVQRGLALAEQAAVRDHCLQRLYGVGIWNRLEAGDMNGCRLLVDQSFDLLNEAGACAACGLELYPWLAYFYFHSGNVERARECGHAVAELARKTGNPIGGAVAAMIESSLFVVAQNETAARDRRREAFDLAESAVTEATHSPVVHYLDLMTDQQAALRSAHLPQSPG